MCYIYDEEATMICCSVLQCVAVWCQVLQCVAAFDVHDEQVTNSFVISWYNPFRGRSDSECSSESWSKSWMVVRFESTANLKSRFEFVPGDTEEFRFNQNLNLNLYREIRRNLSFSISTSWLKSPHHSGFRLGFRRAFGVSSSTEWAVSSEISTHASCVAVCCSVLQCVAVCYSALKCAVVRPSALQCVAGARLLRGMMIRLESTHDSVMRGTRIHTCNMSNSHVWNNSFIYNDDMYVCFMWQCVAVCCSVLQLLQSVACIWSDTFTYNDDNDDNDDMCKCVFVF
jgi:hypothetical protein